MDRVAMTITQLTIFAMLAEQKSFTVAAQRLQISQSAILYIINNYSYQN